MSFSNATQTLPPGAPARSLAHLAVVFATLGLAAFGLVVAPAWLQQSPASRTSAARSAADQVASSPFAVGGSIYEEQVPHLARPASSAPDTGAAAAAPAPTSTVNTAPMQDVMLMLCAALIAAATSLAVLAVERGRRNESIVRTTAEEAGWLTDLSDETREVIGSVR